jgi:hypothetical protein
MQAYNGLVAQIGEENVAVNDALRQPHQWWGEGRSRSRSERCRIFVTLRGDEGQLLLEQVARHCINHLLTGYEKNSTDN